MLVTNMFEVFKQGKSLANSATWKNRAMLGNALFAFLSACVAVSVGFGYDVSSLSDGTLKDLSSGIVAFVAVANIVLHCVTSDKVGLSPKPITTKLQPVSLAKSSNDSFTKGG